MKSLLIAAHLFGSSLLALPALAKTDCETTKAALVLGDHEFALKVARVDVCENKINTIHQVSVPIDFKSYLNSKTLLISPEGIREAKLAMQTLVTEGKQAGASTFEGIGIQVFRFAKNASDVLREIGREHSNVTIKVVNDDEEAKLQFIAVKSKLNPRKALAVWEIRDNGMQLIREDGQNRYQIYRSRYGSLFAEEVVEQVSQGRKPMTDEDNGSAQLKIIDFFTRDQIDSRTHLGEILRTKNLLIAGTGKIQQDLISSIETRKKGIYNIEDLAEALIFYFGKTPSELREMNQNIKNPERFYTNMMLTYGFLEPLQTINIQVVDAELIDGVLLSNEDFRDQKLNLSEMTGGATSRP